MSARGKTVLWWGRFDPDYSRNRILRRAYETLGWNIIDFHPWGPGLTGDLEAMLRAPAVADLVHIPCFRQRDIAAASRYARRRRLPLLLDTLTSQYDKAVHEQHRYSPCSIRARQLLRYEQGLFGRGDVVLSDTPEYARFFESTLLVPKEKLHVVYVGAEEPLFSPGPPHAPNNPIEVLFYGSFVHLQGPEVIVQAARRYQGPPVRWVLLGDGALRRRCEELATGLGNVSFENWIPYPNLPGRIARADILLGVFGGTGKAQRVIPNKVFQAMACGKPVITGIAPSYPPEMGDLRDCGVARIPCGEPDTLARTVAEFAAAPASLATWGTLAQQCYQRLFSFATITTQLQTALAALSR